MDTTRGREAKSIDDAKESVINHDHCDSCGDGGALICCDFCPRSFHFDCINPPMSPAEADTMKAWYCNNCKATKWTLANSDKGEDTILSPIFKKLAATNPQTFVLTSELAGSNQGIHV